MFIKNQYLISIFYCRFTKWSQICSQCRRPALRATNSLQNSLNGTSVFLEPHITFESSQGAFGTKVTATAKFKLELHTPTEQQSHSSSGSSRPSSRSRSRRSSSSGSSSIAADALRSSGDSSLASSLSSDGGFSEK